MKVALLNTYDHGGAGTATRRIHSGLRRIGVDSKMVVQIKDGDEWHVIGPRSRWREAYSMARVVTDPLPLTLHGGAETEFSVGWMPDDIPRQVARLDPAVVHLNWMGDGFINVKSIGEFEVPIVWRLPDMWAFTGGCHYAGECDRFTDACGNCPKLDSERSWDVSRWTWRRKSKSWTEADITVVAPSTWLADRARESSLFGDRRIEVIPNGLDTNIYRPQEGRSGRELFDLPEESRIVLFGAQATSDPRKGFSYLSEALDRLQTSGEYDDVELVVFGSSEPESPPELGFPIHYTGYLSDDQSLSLLYDSADVMVVPSRYEGFGQTVTEAMACGTPVVAFDTSGPSDTVVHEETGYLAEPFDPADLARGISRILDDADRRDELGQNARKRAVDHYAIEAVAERYRDLYKDVVQ